MGLDVLCCSTDKSMVAQFRYPASFELNTRRHLNEISSGNSCKIFYVAPMRYPVSDIQHFMDGVSKVICSYPTSFECYFQRRFNEVLNWI